MMSASSLYPLLCFLKDIRKLNKDWAPLEGSERRLTWVHPLLRMTADRFAHSLNLLNVERNYNLRKTIEVATIDRILSDEDKHLSLRDLPSFYACATELISTMKH